MKKIQLAAIEAKRKGYKYIYSVVKSVFNTVYVHINSIDDVIKNGWIPAQLGTFGKGWHGRLGIPISQLPKKSISRQNVLFEYGRTRTFYFNTGVRPENGSKLYGDQIWRNGTKQIPFSCAGVPENAEFMFACDNEKLPESKIPNVVVRRIVNGGLVSKYAYFRIRGEK